MSADTESPDRFFLFAETAKAAGVDTTSGRFELLLTLPAPLQDIVLADAAAAITGRRSLIPAPLAN